MSHGPDVAASASGASETRYVPVLRTSANGKPAAAMRRLNLLLTFINSSRATRQWSVMCGDGGLEHSARCPEGRLREVDGRQRRLNENHPCTSALPPRTADRESSRAGCVSRGRLRMLTITGVTPRSYNGDCQCAFSARRAEPSAADFFPEAPESDRYAEAYTRGPGRQSRCRSAGRSLIGGSERAPAADPERDDLRHEAGQHPAVLILARDGPQ
jgi:hypothetical protein